MIFYNCSSIYFAKYLMKLQIIRESFGKTVSENHLLCVISYLSIQKLGFIKLLKIKKNI